MKKADKLKKPELSARPRYCWVFVAGGPPPEIYWMTAAATERICRALNREYHECGWKCVRVKVSVAANQYTGRLPKRLHGADWKDIGRQAWKANPIDGDGEWVWRPKRKKATA